MICKSSDFKTKKYFFYVEPKDDRRPTNNADTEHCRINRDISEPITLTTYFVCSEHKKSNTRYDGTKPMVILRKKNLSVQCGVLDQSFW